MTVSTFLGRSEILRRLCILLLVSHVVRRREHQPVVHSAQRTRQPAQGEVLERLQREVRV